MVTVPRPATGLVDRARLFALLDQGVERRVTLVCGPAGSGKTTLVSSWLRGAELPGPAVWVAIDRDESDATRFWATALDELRGSGALSADDPLATVAPAPLGGHDELLRALLDGLERLQRPVVVVFEDLHHLRSEEALRGLEQLLARAPEQLRTIIVSRRDPKVGLAGLRLAALSLSRHESPERFVAEFSGSERTVAEYLLGEVLASEPPEVRELLLRTCILEQVTGPLADVLTGRDDSARLLHHLEEANALVVAVDVGRTWFRYHHLLADLLRLELRREAPDEVAGLHRLAAGWHAEHGDPIEAVRHAQLGGDWALAAELLGRRWVQLVLDGEEATLGALLAGLPA